MTQYRHLLFTANDQAQRAAVFAVRLLRLVIVRIDVFGIRRGDETDKAT